MRILFLGALCCSLLVAVPVPGQGPEHPGMALLLSELAEGRRAQGCFD